MTHSRAEQVAMTSSPRAGNQPRMKGSSSGRFASLSEAESPNHWEAQARSLDRGAVLCI